MTFQILVYHIKDIVKVADKVKCFLKEEIPFSSITHSNFEWSIINEYFRRLLRYYSRLIKTKL